MSKTKIEWTATKNADGTVTAGQVWNPTVGCTKISQGCKFCYAEVMHKRLTGMGKTSGNTKYAQPFTTVLTHPDSLNIPLERQKPTVWFVNSMSDLFHADVPLDYIQAVFAVMNQCPQHTFQVLTKRIERAYQYDNLLTWTPNIWMGTSIEDDRVRGRLDFLREGIGAKVKFLSLEPLIGPLPNLDLSGIDWVIVGGESGRKPRPMRPEWVEDIRLQCEAAGVAFFFKQWGGVNKKESGRILNGRTYDEMPVLPTIKVEVSKYELDILGHSLGIYPGPAKRSKKKADKKLPSEFYRNYFNASQGHSDYACLMGLVAKGLMREGHPNYFHVSENGIQVFRQEFNLMMTTA